jgi:A/G-specific adenine glycosylase
MLQQTSVARVVEPWTRFLDVFPTPRSCAEASTADVLRQWSGLGFPRRALALQAATRVMVNQYEGEVPSSVDDLRALPGVGPYTAHAVASFAFGAPVGVVDTNVGRVFARVIANRPLRASEAQELAHDLVPPSKSARWNQAMLDLGAQYCTATPRCSQCPLRDQCRWRLEGGPDPSLRSAAVSRPQKTFAGSNRQARGRVLRRLESGPTTRRVLEGSMNLDDADRMKEIIDSLVSDGLIERRANKFCLAGDSAR